MALRNKEQAMQVLRTFLNTKMPSKLEAKAKEIAAYALDRAIQLSPYDTGRFIASWRITLDGSVGEAAEPGSRGEDSAAQEAKSASQPAIDSIRMGTKFTLTNGVPYAQYIEYGSPTTSARYITQRVAQSIGGKFGRM